MSHFRDLIARMAVDQEFARYARSNPDAIAAQYSLSKDETDKLRGLADAAAVSGPQALGARLSKSGIGTGGLASLFDFGDGAPAGHDMVPLDAGDLGGLPGHDGGSGGFDLPGGLAGGHTDPGVALSLHGVSDSHAVHSNTDGGDPAAIGPKPEDPAGDGGDLAAIGPKHDDPAGNSGDLAAIGPKHDDPAGEVGGNDLVSLGPKQDDPAGLSGGDLVSLGPKQDDPAGLDGGDLASLGPKPDDPAGGGDMLVADGAAHGVVVQGGLDTIGTGAPSDGGGMAGGESVGVAVQGGLSSYGTGVPSDGGDFGTSR